MKTYAILPPITPPQPEGSDVMSPARLHVDLPALPEGGTHPAEPERAAAFGVPADPLSIFVAEADRWLLLLTQHLSTCNLQRVTWEGLPDAVREHALKSAADRYDIAFFLTVLVARQHGVNSAPPGRVAWIQDALGTPYLADRVARWSSEACAMRRAVVVSGEVN